MPKAKEAQIPLSVEKTHQLQGDNSGPIDQPSHDTTSAAENTKGTEHSRKTRQQENKRTREDAQSQIRIHALEQPR